jgi:hypothetical protein
MIITAISNPFHLLPADGHPSIVGITYAIHPADTPQKGSPITIGTSLRNVKELSEGQLKKAISPILDILGGNVNEARAIQSLNAPLSIYSTSYGS